MPGQINYLRVSITDRCNLRCFYCTPWGGWEKLPCQEILRYEELLRLAGVAAGVGIRKIRVTGGEPLVRRGALEFIRRLHQVPGIEEVCLTTNGVRLAELAPDLLPPACATSTSAWTPCAGTVTGNSPASTTSTTSWPASRRPRPWVSTPSRSTAWS